MAVSAAKEKQGYWNHRVVRYTEPDGTYSFGIHEAHYYVGEHKPFAISENAEPVLAESGNAMVETLGWMQQALNKPLIDYKTREELGTRAAIFAMNEIAKEQERVK